MMERHTLERGEQQQQQHQIAVGLLFFHSFTIIYNNDLYYDAS